MKTCVVLLVLFMNSCVTRPPTENENEAVEEYEFYLFEVEDPEAESLEDMLRRAFYPNGK
jgi:hypothetical protein